MEKPHNSQIKQKKMKKKPGPKKGSKHKSEAKQVISQEGGKTRKRRIRVEDLYSNNEAKDSVMERVEEVLHSIGEETPKFSKCMLPSNVSQGFWMFFPKDFCDEYLPMHNSSIKLIGEHGKEYKTKYLVDRHGLSAGWRGFSMGQRIVKGDHLVFQLVGPCTIKVHIVRVYGLDEVDAALCLMDMVDDDSEGSSPAKKRKTKRKGWKRAKHHVDTNESDIAQRSFKDGLPTGQAKTDSDNLGSEVCQGSEISEELSKAPLVSSKLRKTCSPFKAHKIASSRALQVAK